VNCNITMDRVTGKAQAIECSYNNQLLFALCNHI
jgi:hypothetical protein